LGLGLELVRVRVRVRATLSVAPTLTLTLTLTFTLTLGSILSRKSYSNSVQRHLPFNNRWKDRQFIIERHQLTVQSSGKRLDLPLRKITVRIKRVRVNRGRVKMAHNPDQILILIITLITTLMITLIITLIDQVLNHYYSPDGLYVLVIALYRDNNPNNQQSPKVGLGLGLGLVEVLLSHKRK
jgi:hypothetical protein